MWRKWRGGERGLVIEEQKGKSGSSGKDGGGQFLDCAPSLQAGRWVGDEGPEPALQSRRAPQTAHAPVGGDL